MQENQKFGKRCTSKYLWCNDSHHRHYHAFIYMYNENESWRNTRLNTVHSHSYTVYKQGNVNKEYRYLPPKQEGRYKYTLELPIDRHQCKLHRLNRKHGTYWSGDKCMRGKCFITFHIIAAWPALWVAHGSVSGPQIGLVNRLRLTTMPSFVVRCVGLDA